MERLIVEGNSVYELDEDALKRKRNLYKEEYKSTTEQQKGKKREDKVIKR